MTYAVIEHQLMDVHLAIKKALLYSVGIAFISWGLALIIGSANWLSEKIGIGAPTLALAGGAVAFIVGRMFWKKTQESDRLKYEFVTIIAHKLRTPLTRIRWEIDELQKASSVADAQAMGQKMKESSNALIELVDALLKTAEERAVYMYSFKNTDLFEFSKKVVADYADKLKKKDLTLSVKSETTLPLVKADPEKLATGIQIFLENAILYTPKGGKITITIGSYDINFIIFTIRDTGIGIAASDLPHIFLRLYRAHNATLEHTEGSGVGLFIAKNIIDRHKGIVGVSSDGIGRGSSFWFILPKAGK